MPTFTVTQGDDRIVGTPRNDLIRLHGGRDIGAGRGGADTVFGGPGNDSLFGGNANDTLADESHFFGSGRDRFHGGDGADQIRARGPGDRLFGGDGDDVLSVLGPRSFSTAFVSASWRRWSGSTSARGSPHFRPLATT